MARYQPSKYFADDKDMHDVLSSAKISIKSLLSLARRRGIFLSEECTREELVSYLSKLPFGWTHLQQIMGELEREDREEKLTTCKIETNADLDKFREAAEKVREARGDLQGEHYKITESKTGRLEIHIEYAEPDFQKNRLIQRRQRDVVFEVEKGQANQLEVRSTQNERAETILREIVASLATPEAIAPPVRKTIGLGGISNHRHRTQFFVNLMSNMNGFRLREVKDLKVDRVEPAADEEESEETTGQKTQLKALVKKVALSGENILMSPQYQALANDGFFISRSVWVSIETTGKGRLFEFEAEFKDAQAASNFAYQIRGVYERNKDGELIKQRAEVPESEKSTLKNQLEVAAYASVAEVEKLQSMGEGGKNP